MFLGFHVAMGVIADGGGGGMFVTMFLLRFGRNEDRSCKAGY